MRVAAFPADLGGCGHYRLIWGCRVLVAEGYDIDLVLPTEGPERQLQAAWRDHWDGSRTLVDVVAPDADVVVLQRPLQWHLAEAIPLLQAKGVRVVVEVDDDFTTISRRNISYRAVDPRHSPARNRAHLARACDRADLVTVSTPRLAEVYGAHGRVVVVPNFVPERYLEVTREPHDGAYVGWSGSIETHPDDLQVTGGGVARAVDRCAATMAVVGTGKGVRRALGLNAVPMACGWRTLEDYPEAIAQFDVGIVPLEASLFNEAKSALKLCEFAAVGTPAVVSPTYDNLRMHAEGLGVVASNPRQWEGVVKALLRDDGYREDLAGRGREVMRRFTIEGNAWRTWEAWMSVVNSPVAA